MSDTGTLEDQVTPEEREHQRQLATEDAMRADGVTVEEESYTDYFGFEETHRVDLPDGKSYVLHQALNEGGRRHYMNNVQREVRLAKVTGDAIMKTANGDERRILLSKAIVGWNLKRKDKRTGQVQDVPFNQRTLSEFLDLVNPTIIDIVDKDVRKHNPWLRSEATLEDLEQAREDLDRQIEEKKREEEGKES